MLTLAEIAAAVEIEIGGAPILLRSEDENFRRMLEERYRGFVTNSGQPRFTFDVDLQEPSGDMHSSDDLEVRVEEGRWILRRGDFHAEWDERSARGRIRQSANPYSIDSVLRIVHTLILARQGGFLLHAASVIRGGRAYLFAGVSGAGKTTISRLAPPDATLLTDEISYVRRQGTSYFAYGTPFAGELATSGENCSAPIEGVFLLEKGAENRIDSVEPQRALESLLRNVLFFAKNPELVHLVFQSACEFVDRIPVRQLTFVPDQRVWELIGKS